LESYFECAEFNIGNNAAGYVGPHCGSDGRSIGVGIYGDESCSNYIGDVVDLSQYLSVDDTEESLQIYADKTCIPCKSSESFSLITDNEINNNNNDDDTYTTDHGVYPLCTYLYDASAKCQIHFSDPQSSYQVCVMNRKLSRTLPSVSC